MNPIFRKLLCSVALLGHALLAQSEEVRVLAAGAAKHALEHLTADFERSTGHRLQAHFDTVGAQRDRLLAAPVGTVALIGLQRRLNDLAGVRASVPVGEIGNIVFAAHWKSYEAYGKSLDKMVGEQSVQKLMAKITASGTAEWVHSNLARELPI